MPSTHQLLLVGFGGHDAILCEDVELHGARRWVRERLRGLHTRQMFFRFRDESFRLIPRAVAAEDSATSTRVEAGRAVAHGNECGDAIG